MKLISNLLLFIIMQNMEWYYALNKPFLNPPDWVFAPVWVVLYLLIGISFFLFLKTGSLRGKLLPIILFLLQLFLNILWPSIFFVLKNIFFALVVVCLLWLLILFTIIKFYKFSKSSAYLLIPYFLWVTFAVYLNLAYWALN